MLLSMTGYGDARHQDDRLVAAVEIRTVNNRYLKITTKCAEIYAAFEGEIEKIVRELIGRGTVHVGVRLQRHGAEEDFRLNGVAISSYWHQLQQAAVQLHVAPPSDIGAVLSLPGIVEDGAERSVDLQSDWDIVRRLLDEALQKLQTFRVEEGRAMDRELRANIDAIAGKLGEIQTLAPQVVAEYRAKLLERIRQLLQGSDAQVSEADLIREVSIFADRADINEEITRLRCHLDQFLAFLEETASPGRKLDFLSQEMFREVNTIGSKANHVGIARCVVEMKAAVEKIREVLQNVE